MKSVVWLDTITPDQRRDVGNKALNLAYLAQRGYRTSPGFVVTSSALKQSLSLVQQSVVEALAQLEPPWIVRSSSDAEDSLQRAYAGIFVSVIGLSTPAEVFDGIDRVVQSAFSPMAMAYHRRQAGTADDIRMAVFVQHLLSPSASGVVFSQHPRRPGLIAIESTLGLAAPLVEGTVTPDLIEFDLTLHLLRTQVGSKRTHCVFENGALRNVSTSTNQQQRPSVSIKQARQIAQLALSLEHEFGRPQDIEWAIDQGRLYVLQSRAITTLAAQ